MHATDRDEVVTLRRLAGDTLLVAIAVAGAPAPYFRRTFVPGETSEVRVYLHGGNDRVERAGEPGGPIRVRVVAGEGHDVVDDAASGGTEVWPGAGELDVARGRGTDRQGPWAGPKPDEEKPWVGPRDYGHWTRSYTELTYASELDALLGAGLERTAWGFRSLPEASIQDVSFLWSTGEGEGRLAYSGLFRKPGSRAAFAVDGLASGIERINFFGYGNETAKPGRRDEYRTFENAFSLAPSARLELDEDLQLHADATLQVSDTPTDRDNVLGQVKPYGRGRFAEAGLRAGARYDSRGVGDGLRSGGLRGTVAPESKRLVDARVEAAAFYFPALLDVGRGFGGVDGEAAGYLGRSKSPVQLAARVGGRRVWGAYPWLESAFLGGRASLRGYSRDRFAGDGSLYGSLEARAWPFTLNVPPVPLRFGILAFGDVGRVWLSGEASSVWHPSWGAGVMLQPVATPHVITVAWAGSREGSRWYVGYGVFF